MSLDERLSTTIEASIDSIERINKGLLSRERKRRVLDYIEENMDQTMSLLAIANVAAMSPYHFSRSFKRTMGVSPIRYVWQRRVEAAKRMLIEDTQSLAMVALNCGFKSQSHFTTLFKHKTGMTPAAYRREHYN